MLSPNHQNSKLSLYKFFCHGAIKAATEVHSFLGERTIFYYSIIV